MTLTDGEFDKLRRVLSEHEALQHDYPMVCRAAWKVLHALRNYVSDTNREELEHEIIQLGIMLRYANAQCRCEPPGSKGESCTGHCQPY
jgi:hypothetical protein